jgi:hypothetical protein
MQRSKREQHTGNAARHGDPAGGYASVPTMFLLHTRVNSGGLAVSKETLRLVEEST